MIFEIENGKKEFSINITDDNSKNISKNRLQKMVKKLAVIVSIDHLNKLKNKYSKLDNITVDNLKPRQYLSDKKANISQAKLPFRLRIRVFNCKINFENQQFKGNLLCKICKICIGSQSHY